MIQEYLIGQLTIRKHYLLPIKGKNYHPSTDPKVEILLTSVASWCLQFVRQSLRKRLLCRLKVGEEEVIT